ncbi:MAG: hypothetical protein QM754_10130 [Tepidisphaeraceae bacterium]
MKRTVFSILAAVTLASTAFAATYVNAPAEGLAWLSGLKGTWTLDAKWANGNPFKARQTVEPILNGKFVAMKTSAASGDAPETERDYILFGLSKDGQLVQWVYTPDGQARQTEATATTDGTIQFDFSKTDAKGKTIELRTLYKPIDAKQYGWKLMSKLKGEWHSTLEGTWQRG